MLYQINLQNMFNETLTLRYSRGNTGNVVRKSDKPEDQWLALIFTRVHHLFR